jgi:hypothetical protein
MKNIITILILSTLALGVRAQSSGGSPGSHAANNGGFSQPPTLAPPSQPSAANPSAVNPNNINPNINGPTPEMTNGAVPVPAVTNPVDALGGTNSSAAAGFGTNNGVAPAVTGQNNHLINPHMNSNGDITNANGTMTFNTNAPHWWEKRE